MSEIWVCDWTCQSISRYVGTMLNGAARLRFTFFSPVCSQHGPEPMIEICDCPCTSISRHVGTMLNGADCSAFLCCNIILLSSYPYRSSIITGFSVVCERYVSSSSCLLPPLIILFHPSMVPTVCSISFCIGGDYWPMVLVDVADWNVWDGRTKMDQVYKKL